MSDAKEIEKCEHCKERPAGAKLKNRYNCPNFKGDKMPFQKCLNFEPAQPPAGEFVKWVKENYNKKGVCGETIYKLCDIITNLRAYLACSNLSNKAFRGDLKQEEDRRKALQATIERMEGENKRFREDIKNHNYIIGQRDELQDRLTTAEDENKQLRAIKCPDIAEGDTCICSIVELEEKIDKALACIQTAQTHACILCKDYLEEAEQALQVRNEP